MTKKEILREYLDLSIRADFTLAILEEQEARGDTDVKHLEMKLAKYNTDLAKIEDNNPWISKVLTVLEIG